MEEQFDSIKWINRKFGLHLDSQEIKSITDFSMMWNLFEALACGKHFDFGKISTLIQKHKLDASDFGEFIAYFKTRYIAAGSPNHRVPFLKISSHAHKMLVVDVLTGVNTDNHDMILACTIIIHRLRNNLFHGEKSIRDLPDQIDNFDISNRFIAKFLEKI